MRRSRWLILVVFVALAAARICGVRALRAHAEETAASAPACAPDDGGLVLPDGFCASVFADHVGHARHLVASDDGAVYVNTWSGRYYGNDTPPAGGFLVALRDTTGGGVADEVVRFGPTAAEGGTGGTGIALHAGALYAEAGDRIVRYPLTPGALAPTGEPETIVQDLPLSGDHPMHPFVIDASGALTMNSGSATNACQVENRIARSPGHDPCTELETRAGIWRYDAARTGQVFSPAERFASGIRNAVGIALDPGGRVWTTQHGRDQLAENWPSLYTPEQGANLPAEELLRIESGADYGWPTCYFDDRQQKLVLAPEYGGDGGKAVGACASKRTPVAVFPAHWAPNALLFYTGDDFPARYRGGAFIAFHGSWNRAPFPQEGYDVVFQPLADGKPSGKYEIFADGFAGAVKQPGQATHRPSGLALGPDGALYISDDIRGTIWRVHYAGAAVAHRARPQQPSTTAAASPPALPPEGVPTPASGWTPQGAPSLPPLPADAGVLGIDASQVALGARVYRGEVGGGTCVGCHGSDARGTGLGSDLAGARFVWSDGSYASLVRIIDQGVPNPKQHTGVMPPKGGAQLTDEQVRAVAAYVYALSHAGAAK